MNNDNKSPSSFDDLGLADTQFEQAEEATYRMARLCRIFYCSLVDGGLIPPQVAGPLTITYMQNVMSAAGKNR